MFNFVESIQVCFGGSWAAGCNAIWIVTFFAIVAVVSVTVLSLRCLIQEYTHRRTVNKWFAEQTVTEDED
jgi:hypothetical protein